MTAFFAYGDEYGQTLLGEGKKQTNLAIYQLDFLYLASFRKFSIFGTPHVQKSRKRNFRIPDMAKITKFST